MIVRREVAVMIVKDNIATMLETLHKFSQFGAYTSMMKPQQRSSAHLIQAKSDCHILTLEIEDLRAIRSVYPEVDMIITHTEKFLENEGLPLCDFKLYRQKHQ